MRKPYINIVHGFTIRIVNLNKNLKDYNNYEENMSLFK